MQVKKLSVSVKCIVIAILLQACGGKDPIDAYEQLERPPQIAITPSAESIAVADEKLVSNGLGDKIQRLGKKSSPLLKLNLDFDNTWLLLDKVLRHLKIRVSDHDRERGHYLVSFGTDASKENDSFWPGLTNLFFADKIKLRKYQLSVMQAGAFTDIIAKDVGAVTIEADPDEHIEEVVDQKIKGAADSEAQLLSVLYKHLHDGFVESEKSHKKGFFE
jgi:hypothetical protein